MTPEQRARFHAYLRGYNEGIDALLKAADEPAPEPYVPAPAPEQVMPPQINRKAEAPAKTKGEEIAERMVVADEHNRVGIWHQDAFGKYNGIDIRLADWDRAAEYLPSIRRALASAIDAAIAEERELVSEAYRQFGVAKSIRGQ